MLVPNVCSYSIFRLVTRATIEERMMQQSKKKLLLEHLVVRKMNRGDLKQEELDDILRYGAKELFMEDSKEDGDKEPSPQVQTQEPARVIDIEAARAGDLSLRNTVALFRADIVMQNLFSSWLCGWIVCMPNDGTRVQHMPVAARPAALCVCGHALYIPGAYCSFLWLG